MTIVTKKRRDYRSKRSFDLGEMLLYAKIGWFRWSTVITDLSFDHFVVANATTEYPIEITNLCQFNRPLTMEFLATLTVTYLWAL